ncbi:MAG: hypothetical protein SFW66_03825 [Gammaproteobacteria bacterium]|nr:hypothetical protein [Gammaproteobacteria bacterium]
MKPFIHKRVDAILTMKEKLIIKMQEKLTPNKPWSYINIPEENDENKTRDLINEFINHKLDDFILLCAEILPHLTENDADSIGLDKTTVHAKKFLELFYYLEQQGFPNVQAFNKPLCFWSGLEAKKHVKTKSISVLSDDRVPVISAMFDVCETIIDLQGRDRWSTLLICAVSRAYASFATGQTNVYISSDKPSESPGFTAANYFWMAEMQTLNKLYQRGIVTAIDVHLFDHQTNQWQSPLSLMQGECDAILIRRRYKHPLDSENTIDCFKDKCTSDMTREKWQHSAPRPAISLGALKRIATEWRERTKIAINKRQLEAVLVFES